MRAGEGTQPFGQLRAAMLVLWLLAASAFAIDNPDAPDRVAAFETRAAGFERDLAATDGASASTRAGLAYAKFLDAELNAAFRALQSRLTAPAREALIESQRRWLRFRDAEQRFIEQQWTRERSGSSASLSQFGYRNAVTKQRVLQLLLYLAEYR